MSDNIAGAQLMLDNTVKALEEKANEGPYQHVEMLQRRSARCVVCVVTLKQNKKCL
jgi:hypothetical protein